ncbi:MAG: TIGR04086 family membrane protein [Oscillospiraceae bacterium]|nr:TIGR04086 family membrane protein [Oscillospiraceae bacterium]
MSEKNLKKFAVCTAIGSGIGIISASILIFLMAAALAVGDIPALLISPATVIMLAFGGFCGGFAGAKLSGEKGLLCGVLSGIVFFLIAWAAGGFFGTGGFGTAAIIKAAMIIIASSLGGIIGVNYIKRK